jgi:hypothetical protein
MTYQVDYISAQLVEKDVIKVEFVEKEIISAKFTVVDILNYLERAVVTGLIQEVPTKLSAIRFQTSKSFVTGSLKVFFNGLKIAKVDITEINSTIFEIIDSTISQDLIEVEYLELI